MDFQGFEQIPGVVEGNTQVLPAIQGNTEVLPTISSDGLVQGTNTVLQETAGLTGKADANGFFGTTATTNDIFGETLNTNTETTELGQTITGTDTNPFFGDNQYIQNVDTNTFFGTTGTTIDGTAVFGTNQITNDSNPLLTNQTLAGTQFLPTGTDTNAFYTTEPIPTTTTEATTLYGTTQIMPDAIASGTQVGGVTQTTTTTQTTYNTTPGFQTFGTTDFPTSTSTIIGTTEGIPFTQGFAMQNEYQATGQTTPYSNVGYGTTAADFNTTQTTFNTNDTLTTTAYEIPTTTQTTAIPVQPQPTTNQTTTVTVQPKPVTTQIQSIPQTTTVTQTVQTTPTPVVAQKQIVQNTQIPPQPQVIQANQQQQLITNPYGAKIIDEDFRRGRPIYTETRTTGYKLNNNLLIKPSYKVINTNNTRLLNYGYNNPTIGLSKLGNGLRTHNVNLGTGLDRLGKGGSYDIYSRGVNPLLNKAGLGNVNNVQATSNIKDFL